MDESAGESLGGPLGESLRGRLLVAAPTLLDPNFQRTVVLMLEHTDDGALGVVLNRPSAIDVDGPLPQWHRLAAEPAVVFVGGPVGDGVAIGLGQVLPQPRRFGDDDPGFLPVIGALSSVDLGRDPDDVDGVERVRVFAGYAGWGPLQIEEELAQGGWIIVDAQPDDALSPVPDDLWRAVLRRQPGKLAWLANFPLDPQTN